MEARRLSRDRKTDALSQNDLMVEYMEAEDDCMVARNVVPFDTFDPVTWHVIASDILSEQFDDYDSGQIDRLVERRGLFTHDPAAGPRLIALPAVELTSALEVDLKAAGPADSETLLRVQALDQLFGDEPDFYVDLDAISRAAWDSLSVTMFERCCTASSGERFEIIFDRPDLTTGLPAAHARADLSELRAVLAEIDRSGAGIADNDAYLARLAASLLSSPDTLLTILEDFRSEFEPVAKLLDRRRDGWRKRVRQHEQLSALAPPPHDWTGTVDIVGLVRNARGRSRAEPLGIAPTFFGLYAERSDGSHVWLGAAPSHSSALDLSRQLAPATV